MRREDILTFKCSVNFGLNCLPVIGVRVLVIGKFCSTQHSNVSLSVVFVVSTNQQKHCKHIPTQ